MIYPLTITSTLMRDINRSAILEIIRRESPVSRTAIAKRLDVSLPTVMRIVDELVSEGFVNADNGESEFTGGRRRPLLKFEQEKNLILGLDLGGTKMYGAIANFGGEILDQLQIDKHGSTSEESFSLLTNLINQLLLSPCLKDHRIRGIGIGAPGVTLHHQGIVKWAYTLHWKDFPLREKLMQKYDLPIIVDNDVNLATLGEHWYGVGQNVQNMVLIAIGVGIGSGIIIDGALYRGSHDASGEIGHMITGREYLGKPYIDFGVLESMASGTSITEITKFSPDEVFDAARRQEGWALEVLEGISEHLAVAVANIAVTFDPGLIVLGGGITRSADLLVPMILGKIQNTIPSPPKLVVSKLGIQATVLGIIPNVLHNTFNFLVVRKLS